MHQGYRVKNRKGKTTLRSSDEDELCETERERLRYDRWRNKKQSSDADQRDRRQSPCNQRRNKKQSSDEDERTKPRLRCDYGYYYQRRSSHSGERVLTDSELARLASMVSANLTKQLKTDDPTDDDKCVICIKNRKTHIAIPCAHYQFCEPCTSKIISNNCPICQQPVTAYKKVI